MLSKSSDYHTYNITGAHTTELDSWPEPEGANPTENRILSLV